MKLTIKYFGLLAEITQCNEELFDFYGTRISELRDALCLKYESLAQKEFQIAQDHILVTNETKISDKDIALLPPFAGG